MPPMIGAVDHIYYWIRDMDGPSRSTSISSACPLLRRDGNEWAEFDAGSIRFAIHGTDDGRRRRRAAPWCFRVDDLEAPGGRSRGAASRSTSYVGEVEGFARFATFRDPDGNPVQIIEYAAG